MVSQSPLLCHQPSNISLQICWQNHFTRLAHEKFAIKVPVWFFRSSGFHEELPNFARHWPRHVAQLHQNARKVLGGGKCGNFFVRTVFLLPKLPGRKSQNDQLRIGILLAQLGKAVVFLIGLASFGGHVGGIDDLADEFRHFLHLSIAAEGGEFVKLRGSHGR